MPFLLRSLLLIAFLLPLSGCSGPVQHRTEDGRIIVEFWHALSAAQGRAVNDLADSFNASQDTYYVRAMYQGNYNALSQKLIASLYAGRNPAISQMYPGWTTRYFEFGFMQPMENFIAKDPEFAATLDDIFPIMISESSMPDATGQEVLVTLPFNKSVYVLIVNQTLMEELGWETAPQSWDDFRALAEAMTVRPEGGAATRFGFATRTEIESLTVLSLAAGSHVLDQTTLENRMNHPAVVDALRFLHSAVDRNSPNAIGYVETNFLSGVFGAGRIGMYIGSTASFPFNDLAVGNRFIWRAYPVPPKNPLSDARTLMQGTNVGIFNNIPEEVQLGAWEFAKYIVSPEANARFAMATGYMPVRRSTKELPEFAAFLEDDVRFAAAVELLEVATYDPRAMFWDSVRNIVGAELDGMLRSRTTPEIVVRNVSRQVEQLIERNR